MNEQDITARFYHAVYKSVMEDRSKEIHVSDILYECLRRAWYSKHLPPRFTRDTAMIFWIGDQLHLTPISKTHELSLSWYGIHGTIDEYIDGFIIDKKSCRSLPKYPYSNHVKQVEYYSALMENNGYEVQGGFMLYIFVGTKDEKPKAKVLRVQLREPRVIESEMMHQTDQLSRALEDEAIPPRVIGWSCDYCDWNAECFSNE
jgi:CRISPR/Cas system-associated exonuclease Cas4 (RecB family)